MATCNANPELPRIAFIGVGQELRGDDAAGIVTIRALQPLAAGFPFVYTVEAGPAPENLTGPITRFHPHLALVLDAADLEEPPGAYRLLASQDMEQTSLGTHALSLEMFSTYLVQETACDFAIIGIQPARLDFSSSLSPEVEFAVKEIVSVVSEVFFPARFQPGDDDIPRKA